VTDTETARFLADRLEIEDLLTHYATIIDGRHWDAFGTVFTADATLDYRSAGGIRGTLPEVAEWLATVLPVFTWTQHLVFNRAVSLTRGADHATSRADFQNPNGAVVDGQPWFFLVGGAYHDRLVRTPDGWRIAHRVEETLWWQNPMPGLPAAPPPVPADAFD
jgi:3-phenylpropionate/cinnamic acid dioxygenase small subunit